MFYAFEPPHKRARTRGKKQHDLPFPFPFPHPFWTFGTIHGIPKLNITKIQKKKTWYIVDATDKILGRLASTIAVHIRGKNLATYTPSVDLGAFVIVVNAEKSCCIWKEKDTKSSTGGIQED
ncbi:hypothetical protein ES332_A05G289400v1 [Gossypium tomentosum]|uniref:Uncharacterized protein n=1 Tax=Gossypium tomentosum TaxID=34277 RepID=A0A5D2QKF5_GOSTO|nr:hypothetical protein ES332_A05G289400v1 [Gossypium tomentosum]